MNRVVLLVMALLVLVFTAKYLNHKTAFYGDAAGYYQYVPSAFIYHNLTTFAPLPANRGLSRMVREYGSPRKDPDDTTKYIINQYTYGVAMMEAPFFAVAHIYELASGGLANGYNGAYEWLIKLSSLVYAFLGLMLVYKILRRFFDETPALAATILLFVGTNLFWFTILQTGMSHVPLFFLYALLIYLTIRLHETPKWHLFIFMGLTAGMITVIRPTDIICLAIPLFYNVYGRDSFREKLSFLRSNISNILLLAVAFAIPILPQLIYWKVVTGHFVYYSYRDQSFFWKHPWIKEGLFYFSNGWLPYTPIMFFALFGMLCFRQMRRWALTIWLLLPVYIYIIYSWYCFNYINGFGSRPMLHMYPLLAIPFAAFIVFMWRRPWWLRSVFALIVTFCVVLNISQSYQQMRGILWSEESNAHYNYQMLFRNELTYNDAVVMDTKEFQPDTAKLVKLCTFAAEHYNDSISEHTVRDPLSGAKYVYHAFNETYQEVSIAVPYNKQQFADARWMRCSGRFLCVKEPGYFKHMLVVSVGDKLWRGVKIENKCFDWEEAKGQDYLTLFYYELNRWCTVYYYAKIPDGFNETDMIKMFVWSQDESEIYIDDLKIDLYK